MKERYIKNKSITRGTRSSENLSCQFKVDAEGQFINSETLYCQAIENAEGVPFHLIFGSRSGEGYYLNVGSGIKQLLGISPEEFSEKVFHEMIDEIVPLSDNIPSELSVSREKFISGELKNYKAEILIRMPGGERKWIKDTSLPLIDKETGEVVGAFGILFDINERKLNLSHIERVKEKVIEGDRLKSSFLRNISHEIRTPLNAIVGFSTLLSEPDKAPEERQEFMDIILRSTDHLLEIVNDIVEISNIEADTVRVRKGVINLNTALRGIYDRYNLKAGEKNISLRFSANQDESDVSIFTDGFKLSQILKNLIDNAMKFTEKGEVEFGYSINNNMVKFYISDTGIGIPTEDHQLIFSRFYQAESNATRRFEGTGLGLSIAKAYVELLGGEIWFTSKPGEGSVFYFSVPCERVGG